MSGEAKEGGDAPQSVGVRLTGPSGLLGIILGVIAAGPSAWLWGSASGAKVDGQALQAQVVQLREDMAGVKVEIRELIKRLDSPVSCKK